MVTPKGRRQSIISFRRTRAIQATFRNVLGTREGHAKRLFISVFHDPGQNHHVMADDMFKQLIYLK
jgi:hypothetical protein